MISSVSVCPFACPYVRLFVCSFHLFVCSFVCSFICSFVCLFIHLFPFIQLFVCLFVCLLVKSFSVNWLISSNFLHEVRGLKMLKLDGGRFLWKIHFCPNLGQKSPKLGIVLFFLMLSLDFPQNNAKWKELQSHLIYKFLCGNCNVTYYSKTELHLNVLT